MRNIAIKSTFKECQNEHIYKYNTISIKDQILKSLCIGVKKEGISIDADSEPKIGL